MQANTHIIDRSGCLVIQGNLNFETVMILWQESQPFFTQYDQLIFDFNEVVNSNSAGLALILEWKKLSIKLNKHIKFQNLPAQLSSIIDTASMHDLIF